MRKRRRDGGDPLYNHAHWDDPRIKDLWNRQAECFDRAIALLEAPGYRKLLKADGFDVPIIFFSASRDESVRRPTIVLNNGFDGSMEELYHLHGAAALERGYNVICYDGPGQPSVRRDQALGFIHQWEKVVAPVIDYLETLPCVDARHIGLLGYSMSSVLAARAAAFEHRVACVFQVDGLWDFSEMPLVHSKGMDKLLALSDHDSTLAALEDPTIPAGLRWALSHGMWCFKGVADWIRCPVLVGNPEHDMFLHGQPEKAAEALGDRATMVKMTDGDGAGAHCHCGAERYTSQVLYDWFEEKVLKR
ncbi:Alpha/Beta hydrolase protein [Xylariomycetidae sp. FL2044]|nr:Alpha/Beta hydrolase protein [Xylariomycetidae sp. FL2044]